MGNSETKRRQKYLEYLEKEKHQLAEFLSVLKREDIELYDTVCHIGLNTKDSAPWKRFRLMALNEWVKDWMKDLAPVHWTTRLKELLMSSPVHWLTGLKELLMGPSPRLPHEIEPDIPTFPDILSLWHLQHEVIMCDPMLDIVHAIEKGNAKLDRLAAAAERKLKKTLSDLSDGITRFEQVTNFMSTTMDDPTAEDEPVH